MNWPISGSGRSFSPPGWRAATTENTSAFRSHHCVIQPGFVKFLRIYGLVYHSEGNNPTSLTAGFDLLTLPSHISMNSPTIGGWLALIGWLPQWRNKLRNSRVFDRELSTHSFVLFHGLIVNDFWERELSRSIYRIWRRCKYMPKVARF